MRWPQLFAALLLVPCISAAHGDIYQWEWIDPLQPELGKQQSSTLTPSGARFSARPYASYYNWSAYTQFTPVDFTRAWLRGFDLHGSGFTYVILTEADLREADLASAHFRESSDLSLADLSGALC